MRRALRSLALACSLLTATTGTARAASARGEIALTFDDLPGLSLSDNQAGNDRTNRTLLRGLKRHHIPAIGFVNEGKLDEGIRRRQVANLKRWVDAGMDLGNHTFGHDSPNEVGAKAYIADIARGEPVTRQLLKARGKRLAWFRHPYLETGSPEPVKREIDGWLSAHGYRIAPVTLDANDWEFAEPYDDAVARHDAAAERRIRALYLAYTDRAIGWYQQASQVLFGRQIAYVMLLHDSRLNADCLDDLAKVLQRRGLRPVSLTAAMKDPAYAFPDLYAGTDGIDWMERWALQLHKSLPWDAWQDPPAEIAAMYARTNGDQR